MNLKEQLKKCDKVYALRDYKALLKLSDEILERYPDNQTAIGYKGISHCFLGQYDEAKNTLEKAIERHPKNFYLKNNLAMVYYDLGEYEKSLKLCEEGLKISDFEWLYENKIKALLKLERLDDAIECYENAPHSLDICDLLTEAGECSLALKYCLDEDDFEPIIDKIKEKSTDELGDYYISWIYKIKSKSDIRFCPDCRGELIPIVWGLPRDSMLKRAARGEILLGGCILPPNPPNYYCKKCKKEFDFGIEGLYIECEDYKLYRYIEYKIRELISLLRGNSLVVIRCLDTLKSELEGFDDEEFDAFIKHLIELDCLCQPREGCIRLVGYDDFRCAKEYLDEGKFAAPKWLVYPQLSAWTIGWRMGAGETYAMNEPVPTEEFRELFPMPKYWNFRFSKSPYKPHPPLSYFWTENGKPVYPNASEGIEVNDFITLSDEKEFTSDTFRFKSIEHAMLLSKCLHFDKSNRKDGFDALNEVEFTPDEEKNWDIHKYSVLLNASYFMIMQDEDLKRKLLETGDEPLIYVSDDEENLFGRALMELRDEIRRICKNEERIDWEYTEYLKYKPW